MNTKSETLKRECLELLVEQNPMLNKDSIIALYHDLEKAAYENDSNRNLKELIKKHNY